MVDTLSMLNRRHRLLYSGVFACLFAGVVFSNFNSKQDVNSHPFADAEQPRLPAKPVASGVRIEHAKAGGVDYVIARVDLQVAKLSLNWKDQHGNGYRSFGSVIRASQQRVIFATNSGIFDPSHTPCGWHVEEGHELMPLNLHDGDGNFFLKPNGVFMIDGSGARIVESKDAVGSRNVKLAVQSGPLLLNNGSVHPKFKRDSTHKTIRNGVGIISPTEICFIISVEPVNLFDFAMFFKERLGCKDALYLDGTISKFYAPDAGLTERGGDFAGIFTVGQP